jgi:peptidoglycan hydrolase CwlO-like protein
MGMAQSTCQRMSGLEFGAFPNVATKHSDSRSTDCNNDLVLQGISNLQKDLSEIKTDIKALSADVSEIKGDIKVINSRIETINTIATTNNNDIKSIHSKIYTIYGGLAILVLIIPFASKFLLK